MPGGDAPPRRRSWGGRLGLMLDQMRWRGHPQARAREQAEVAIDRAIDTELSAAGDPCFRVARIECVSRIASAMAASSPSPTSRPYRPPSRISRGPLGQSVLTTGAPQASAWIRTPGRPSWRDDRTKTPACAM